MAADKSIPFLGFQDGKYISVGLAVDIAYKGTLINLNTSGYGAPASDTASEVFWGLCVSDDTDNSGGSAGDEVIEVYRGPFRFKSNISESVATLGEKRYVSDDSVVTNEGTATNDVLVGKIIQVISSDEVLLDPSCAFAA